ncbi:tannase and feruloyl esterase domain-containing protein [Trichoderma breve]|uniref:Carboxylic ester hydrolase n=1 Tax=Trichoderma breve TaxID=2034170 RepID=A0A9W9E7Y4_9HYPO|nr:tannase and feruloyl esterase domain-containing protein [Trichoderma breve]KAJ4857931.1 tannase and feruloyl esterase domain-containing protein [Trichoderma breve]
MAKLSLLHLLATLVACAAADGEVSRHPRQSCAHLKAPCIPGAEIISINGTELWNYTVPAVPGLLPSPVSGLDVCAVDVVLTHPGAHDKVLVKVWMPLEGWNGRFQANGGVGYAAGELELTLGPTIKQGYSSASTDAGVGFNPSSPEAWALRPDGSVNRDALINFSYRSVHDMALVGKEITEQFYGQKPKYSYWNGCSTGGRQAMVAAQRYPDLFDGILAGAPAIYWPTYVIAEQWPQVVMKMEKSFPSPCELKAFTDAAIAECDGLDGIVDGVINDPDICHFNPYALVGRKIPCDGVNVTITEATASVVQKVLQGPFGPDGESRWYGLNPGAALDSLTNTNVTHGKRVGLPFFVNDAWIKYWIAKDPNYDLSKIDYATLDRLFARSDKEYDAIIGTDNPNLSGFQKSGGKLLMWHGLSDQLIFPKGTVEYRNRVERLMGGSEKVNEFFRLFLAPGVDHCAGTPSLGAVPTDPLAALVNWVENKRAPLSLAAEIAGSQGGARIICPYPQIATYIGGDTKSASSFKCI